jgi:hypothetical protein
MILNVFSITELLLGLLSLLLMAWAGTMSLVLASRWSRSSTASERSRIEDRSHLIFLVAVVVLGMRLINWPFFYATLRSFIPDIDGAMCIFGVTQVCRIATGLAELVKPLSFFLIGGFFLAHMIDHRTRTSPLMGRNLFFIGCASVVVILDSLLDIYLMLNIAPGQLVSCCTTVTDILDRATRRVPQLIFGPKYASILEYGYYVSNILLLAVLGACWAAIRRGASFPRRTAVGFIFAYAIANAALFLVVQIDVHAPKIMGLPFHHCLYCMWQYVPDTIVMYGLFISGTFATGWCFLLELVTRTSETADVFSACLGRLLEISMLCLAAALIMNTVHLAMV